MPSLGLTDIDPLIAERVREKDASVRRFSAIGNFGDALRANATQNPEQKRVVDAEFDLQDTLKQESIQNTSKNKRNWRKFGFIFFIFIFIFISFPLSCIITDERSISSLWLGIPCFILAIVFTLLVTKETKSTSILNIKPRDVIPSATVVATLRTLGRSETDGAYCLAAAEVFSAETSLGTGTAKELLNSLGELLGAARRLEGEKNSLEAALAGQSLAEIESERDALSTRRDATGDEMARETLSESLMLCEARLGRARALAPVRERVEVQLDGISQTMRSVQSSVAALRIAPGETDLSALQETARNLTQKTHAIESAVQEVLRLR
jgi:hypothetical protein